MTSFFSVRVGVFQFCYLSEALFGWDGRESARGVRAKVKVCPRLLLYCSAFSKLEMRSTVLSGGDVTL